MAPNEFDVTTEYKINTVGDPLGTFSVVGITNQDTLPTDVQISSFGGGVFPRLLLRNARGTAQTPTAVKAGDYLGLISMQPFNGSGRVIPGALAFRAAEDFDQGHNGTYVELYVTPSGSSANAIRGALALWDNGSLVITASGTEPTIKPNPGRMSAVGFDVGTQQGQNTQIAAGGQTFHFTGGILTSVTTP